MDRSTQNQIEQATDGRSTAEALVKLRQDINLAIQGRQLTALANCVASIEDLRARERNPTLTEELAILLGETRVKLRELRTELAIRLIGDYEKFYEEARKVVDAGIMECWDGRSERVRPVSEVLIEAATALIEFRKGKATERMQLAERDLKNGNPHRGLALYTEALAFLTHLTLKTEERDKIVYVIGGEGNLPKVQGRDLVATERAEIEEGLREAQTLRDRWNDGFKLTQEAGQATDPRRALGLLRDAQALFNQPPLLIFAGLDESIRRREQDLAAELTAQVDGDCTDAAIELGRNNFVSAITLLKTARSKAAEIQRLIGNGELATLVETRTQLLIQQECRFTEVTTILRAVEQQLTGSTPNPSVANELLNNLQGAEWNHPLAIQFKNQIAAMQIPAQNWHTAQQAYHDEHWQIVVDKCRLLVYTQYHHQAQVLGGRAAALLAFIAAQRHQVAASTDINSARQFYANVVTLIDTCGTDEQTQTALQVAQQQIQAIDHYIQSSVLIQPEGAQPLTETEQQ